MIGSVVDKGLRSTYMSVTAVALLVENRVRVVCVWFMNADIPTPP